MYSWSPQCVLRHRPILWMVERSDADIEVWIPLIDKRHWRTALWAEGSLAEATPAEICKLTLREPEGGARDFHGRAKEAATVLPARRAMTIIRLGWGLFRLVAHSAAETATCDWNVLVGHR